MLHRTSSPGINLGLDEDKKVNIVLVRAENIAIVSGLFVVYNVFLRGDYAHIVANKESL